MGSGPLRVTAASAGVALLAIGMVLGFAPVHVDDVDATLYQVVARNIVAQGDLFHLHGFTGLFSDFREHPPGLFWVIAAVIATVGDGAVPWVCGLFGLGTLALVYSYTRGAVGERAALAATVMLALCESFFRYQARPRLDGALTFFFTASVLLGVTARGRMSRWILCGLAAGAGAMVKGPPALGAPVAAVIFILIERGLRAFPLRGAVVAMSAALLLPGAFFLYDHVALDGWWREGYVQGQLLASALGGRTDGHTDALYLLKSLTTRFWPGLPFVIFALLRPRQRLRWALLAWALFIPLGFEAAARAYWHYNMPAYVPLAILAGIGLDDLVRRWPALDRPQLAGRVLLGVGVLIALAVPLGLAQHLQRPCPFGDLPRQIRARHPKGDSVGLMTPKLAYGPTNILGFETRLDVVHHDSALLVVDRSLWPLAGYQQISAHGKWVLAERLATP